MCYQTLAKVGEGDVVVVVVLEFSLLLSAANEGPADTAQAGMPFSVTIADGCVFQS